MNEKVFNKTTEYVDKITESLSGATKHAYEILVRQQIIEGSITIVIGIILMALVLACGKYLIVTFNEGYSSDTDEVLSWLSALVLFTITPVSIALLVSGLYHISNPEYYAIKTIIESLK